MWVWSWSLRWEASFEVLHHTHTHSPHKTKKKKIKAPHPDQECSRHQGIKGWEMVTGSAETGIQWNQKIPRKRKEKDKCFSVGLEDAGLVGRLTPGEKSPRWCHDSLAEERPPSWVPTWPWASYEDLEACVLTWQKGLDSYFECAGDVSKVWTLLTMVIASGGSPCQSCGPWDGRAACVTMWYPCV